MGGAEQDAAAAGVVEVARLQSGVLSVRPGALI